MNSNSISDVRLPLLLEYPRSVSPTVQDTDNNPQVQINIPADSYGTLEEISTNRSGITQRLSVQRPKTYYRNFAEKLDHFIYDVLCIGLSSAMYISLPASFIVWRYDQDLNTALLIQLYYSLSCGIPSRIIFDAKTYIREDDRARTLENTVSRESRHLTQRTDLVGQGVSRAQPLMRTVQPQRSWKEELKPWGKVAFLTSVAAGMAISINYILIADIRGIIAGDIIWIVWFFSPAGPIFFSCQMGN